jgi:MFS family permease
MGLHSMCGYAGGFTGPLVIGVALDLFGRDTVAGWSIGFGHTAVVTLLALAALRRLSAAPSNQP